MLNIQYKYCTVAIKFESRSFISHSNVYLILFRSCNLEDLYRYFLDFSFLAPSVVLMRLVVLPLEIGSAFCVLISRTFGLLSVKKNNNFKLI